MKSGISFFNKTMFVKNITLYWPIWAMYLLFLLGSMPGALWVDLYYSSKNSFLQQISYNKLDVLADVLDVSIAVVSIFFMALITGMALYHYLYQARSANMIHALPVTRSELFGTNLISGLSFMLVPQISSFLISMVVCLSYGMTQVEYLAQYLLVQMGISILAFSIVTFCAMLTGQLFALPVFYAAAQFSYLLAKKVIVNIVTVLGYGVSDYGMMQKDYFLWLSPMEYLSKNVMFHSLYDKEDVCYALKLQNGYVVALYLFAAVLFLVLAYVFYQKRMLEDAGDFITVGFVRPIFRWGAGGVAGIVGVMLLYSLLDSIGFYVTKAVVFLVGLLIGGIGFFLSQMILKKNFRVFRKKELAECGLFLSALCLCFLGVHLTTIRLEVYLPELSEIRYAYLEDGQCMEFRGEEAAEVLEIHKDMLQYRKEYQNGCRSGTKEETFQFYIRYVLTNGKIVERTYILPVEVTTGSIQKRIQAVSRDPDNFLKSFFCYYYNNSDIMDFTGGEFEQYVEEPDGSISFEEDKSLSKEHAEVLFEAIKKDCRAGVLQKYNLYDGCDKYETECEDFYLNSINLYYELQIFGKERQMFWESTMYQQRWYWGEIEASEGFKQNQEWASSFLFGEDCENIIQALLELGIISSKDELIPHTYDD